MHTIRSIDPYPTKEVKHQHWRSEDLMKQASFGGCLKEALRHGGCCGGVGLFVFNVVYFFLPFQSYLATVLFPALVVAIFGATLNIFSLKRRGRKNLERLAKEKTAWDHEEFVHVIKKIEQFNTRLEALKEFAKVAGSDAQPGVDVVAQYSEEREQLFKELQVCVQRLDDIQRAEQRKRALLRLQEVLAKNRNAEYRTTQDVADLVYTNNVRIALEETIAGEAPEELTLEDLPADHVRTRHN